jgi:hypothetical protein
MSGTFGPARPENPGAFQITSVAHVANAIAPPVVEAELRDPD